MRFRPLLLASACALGLAATPAPAAHLVDPDTSAAGIALTPGTKNYNNGLVNITDGVLRDGSGREVVLRGWNVSGETKLNESGFKPFKSVEDARASLTEMRARSGSNVIRFLISWEGVNPQVDTIDTAYLAAITEQIRVAAQLGFYVLVDWHEDLFSRHLFNADSWHTGNGAPKWVIAGGDYPAEYCGVVCASWSQHNLTDEAVRRAARNFWNNVNINTSSGAKPMQDAYIAQMQAAVTYLKANLSAQEFAYVLGVDPWNEPIDGGMEGLTAAQWDNQKLWPFYRKVRAMLDANGWYDKPVYAEPLVFWNTNVGDAIAPATGGHYLTDIPTRGFVFNSHFYDAGRQGTDSSAVNNGSYLTYLHQVRDEGRYLKMPPFLSEFGMFIGGTGSKDTNRTIAAMHQALDSSDALKTAKDRFVDAYSPPVSGTEWHWDWYADRHSEVMNGNASKVLTTGDAWNDENYSAISTSSSGLVSYKLGAKNVERVVPRAAQGDIMGYHYNALVTDASSNVLNWLALRPILNNKEYFRSNQWALLTWRGRKSSGPTEIALPSSWAAGELVVVTEKAVASTLAVTTTPTNAQNEIMLTTGAAGEKRLLVWDDVDSGEDTTNGWHYALVVRKNSGETISAATLTAVQTEVTDTVVTRKQSVVYFTGTMTNSGYAADKTAKAIALTGSTYSILWNKYINFSWDGATGDVDILVNGAKTQTGGATDSRTAWWYSGTTTYQVCERGGRRCSNVYTAK